MNLSDQHIKAILKEARVEYSNDIELENNIMDMIDNLKGYDSLIQQAQNRAKLGLKICGILITLLIISIFYTLGVQSNQSLVEFEVFLPSTIVFFMMIIIFILIQSSRELWIKKDY